MFFFIPVSPSVGPSVYFRRTAVVSLSDPLSDETGQTASDWLSLCAALQDNFYLLFDVHAAQQAWVHRHLCIYMKSVSTWVFKNVLRYLRAIYLKNQYKCKIKKNIQNSQFRAAQQALREYLKDGVEHPYKKDYEYENLQLMCFFFLSNQVFYLNTLTVYLLQLLVTVSI